MTADISLINKKKRIIETFWAVEIALCVSLIISYLSYSLYFTLLILTFVGLFLIPFVLARKNKISAATSSFIIIATLLCLAFIWQNGGLNDEVMLVFPLIVAFSVLFGSLALFKFVFFIVAINIVLIGVLNEYGFVNHQAPNGGNLTAIFTLLIFTLISITLWKFGTDFTNALDKLNKDGQDLEEKVAERTKELEASIEELKKAHEKLSEAEKMASLGRLVAGISHEVNTPIGIAVTAASHLQMETKALEKSVDEGNLKKSVLTQFIKTTIQSTSLVDSNLRRAAELIGDFKELAVLNTARRRNKFLLKPAIEEILKTLEPTIEAANAALTLTCPNDVNVFHDQGAIAQVLINLINNSCLHGIPDSAHGKITINITTAKQQIKIDYSDNGKGLSEEVAKHIFEPFYTTKRNQGGTGLGMNIVYNLVKQTLCGTIEINQKVENGANFLITLPQYAPDH